MTSHDMSFHFMPLIMFMSISISISISVSPIPAIYNISITLSFSQMTEREKVMKKDREEKKIEKRGDVGVLPRRYRKPVRVRKTTVPDWAPTKRNGCAPKILWSACKT